MQIRIEQVVTYIEYLYLNNIEGRRYRNLRQCLHRHIVEL